MISLSLALRTNAVRSLSPIQRAINILITESGDGLATEAGTYITLE
jgi:hypothetical protein